jgi:hypothetical protein
VDFSSALFVQPLKQHCSFTEPFDRGFGEFDSLSGDPLLCAMETMVESLHLNNFVTPFQDLSNPSN